jgi:predicted ferric reductase
MKGRPWFPTVYRVTGYLGAGAGLVSAGFTIYVNAMNAGIPLRFLHLTVAALAALSLVFAAGTRGATFRGEYGGDNPSVRMHSYGVILSLLLLFIHLFLRLVQGGLIG